MTRVAHTHTLTHAHTHSHTHTHTHTQSDTHTDTHTHTHMHARRRSRFSNVKVFFANTNEAATPSPTHEATSLEGDTAVFHTTPLLIVDTAKDTAVLSQEGRESVVMC